MEKTAANDRRHQRVPGARRAAGLLAGALLAASALQANAAPAALALDPLMAGQYAAGNGAQATFLRIDGNWQGSTVHYREPTDTAPKTFSNTPAEGFTRIGEYGWGTGIWGIADWRTINSGSGAPILGSWSGLVPTINHGDAVYDGLWATGDQGNPAWGQAAPLPAGLFPTGAAEENWTAHYTGYIRITDPGLYNFGVLYDDGFFFRLWGAGAGPLEIASDFLSPRDRLGFSQDLALGTGLYGFELGAYDRLEAGVVNLAWKQGGGDWQTIPTAHLLIDPVQLTAAAVPVSTPGTAGVLLAGLTAFAARRPRKRT